MSNTSAPEIRTRLEAVHGCRAEDVRGCLWYNHEEGETQEILGKRNIEGGRAVAGDLVSRQCFALERAAWSTSRLFLRILHGKHVLDHVGETKHQRASAREQPRTALVCVGVAPDARGLRGCV